MVSGVLVIIKLIYFQFFVWNEIKWVVNEILGPSQFFSFVYESHGSHLLVTALQLSWYGCQCFCSYTAKWYGSSVPEWTCSIIMHVTDFQFNRWHCIIAGLTCCFLLARALPRWIPKVTCVSLCRKCLHALMHDRYGHMTLSSVLCTVYTVYYSSYHERCLTSSDKVVWVWRKRRILMDFALHWYMHILSPVLSQTFQSVRGCCWSNLLLDALQDFNIRNNLRRNILGASNINVLHYFVHV